MGNKRFLVLMAFLEEVKASDGSDDIVTRPLFEASTEVSDAAAAATLVASTLESDGAARLVLLETLCRVTGVTLDEAIMRTTHCFLWVAARTIIDE